MAIPTKPTRISWGDDVMKDLNTYVWDNITSLKASHNDLHQNKVTKWRRLYKGIPKDEVKAFPWKNASNVVIQVIGTHVDSLRARVLGSIFEISPLYVAQLMGDWKPDDTGEEQRDAVEEFMNYVGLEPKELDLYRVFSSGAGECIKYGTCFWKFPWETQTEQVCIGDAGAANNFKEVTIYDGPRPEKLPFTHFMVTPTANTLDQADFKVHIRPLKKHELLERKYKGLYDDAKVNDLIDKPDRGGASEDVKKAQAAQNIKTTQGYQEPEWDIMECWFPFWHNKKKYRLIVSYHYATKQILRGIFNFYPDNEEPFESARLGYDGEDGIYGNGFCEMLEHYQEEITTTHNQRADNRTLANTSIARVSKSSKLDSIFSLYPGALMPGEKDEFEIMQLGANYPSSVNEEQLTLKLAQERSGVDSGQSGPGGGVQNPRKGIYSAMGTFAVLQAGNRRVNVNTTDLRYSHVKIGRKLLSQYANFGIGERIAIFKDKGKFLEMALENIKRKRIGIPIRAATASVNKELEKQNDMMLANIVKQHHMGVAQLVQGLQNPQIPPELANYMRGVILASNYLMTHILRNFGHDDVSRLLPLPESVNNKQGAKNGGEQNRGKSQSGGTGSQSVGTNPVEQGASQAPGANANVAATTGIETPTTVSHGTAGVVVPTGSV